MFIKYAYTQVRTLGQVLTNCVALQWVELGHPWYRRVYHLYQLWVCAGKDSCTEFTCIKPIDIQIL